MSKRVRRDPVYIPFQPLQCSRRIADLSIDHERVKVQVRSHIKEGVLCLAEEEARDSATSKSGEKAENGMCTLIKVHVRGREKDTFDIGKGDLHKTYSFAHLSRSQS